MPHPSHASQTVAIPQSRFHESRTREGMAVRDQPFRIESEVQYVIGDVVAERTTLVPSLTVT